ncbi:hypothetical protein TWF569_008723 [Orbilia oligospora]|uniref:Ubiquitin-like domain-containing protein n=1 Tax=Orbilia oligospora TaxID=2813651 RepID=A0A7C8J908_ORBOL|nr:hypothetical protein TWF706_003879 [Orbilia oligospora]KAF3097247.1 hypothetical protein TWF103_009550 [Orbilia oligospora]KAF3103096.1 hypothetical protein TWF102_003918 [Orbilia oligospora]KAF3138618.1 hypothetical protein TWF569_008723 [Orbilia oligospora]KAF3142426.1 hypothetical protein TWF703_000815 [Orbilia oligospora]
MSTERPARKKPVLRGIAGFKMASRKPTAVKNDIESSSSSSSTLVAPTTPILAKERSTTIDPTSPTASQGSLPPLKKEPSTTIDLTSPTASQATVPSGSQDPKKTEKKKEFNDLEFFGRSKDVHAGMRIVAKAKRQKEAEAREQRAKAAAEEKKKIEPRRYSKRRKSDDEAAILIGDDENDDGKDPDFLPRKNRDPTLTPRTSVEPIDPSEVDRVLEAFNKKKAEVEARSRVLSPPLSTQLLASQHATYTNPADASKDIVIQILIISGIPGTKPMVFNRKFGQTLGKVRDTWARMQGFTEDQIQHLVLVWQNETRAFDSTVPKSLGIRFDRDGKMYLDGKGGNDSFSTLGKDEREAIRNGIKPDDCRIYFDAMWDEEFEGLLRQREAAKEREKALELSSDHEDEEVVTGIALNTQMMEITLKGKHFKELQLKVKPSMKISEVIEKMRDERKIDEDTEIELHFDGEELEEDMTLEDAEIEDEFQIDVVLR